MNNQLRFSVLFELLKSLQQDPQSSGSNSRRLFHGRGHCYPDYEWLTIDWYPPVLVATVYKNPGEEALAELVQQLQQTAVPVFIQYRDGRDVAAEWLGDQPEQPVYATRNKLKFQLNLGERQNLGYFVDMEPGRQWLEKNCVGRGLNLFAYTCALSCVALASSANEVVNVDMSRGALSTGQRNHQLNKLNGGRFVKANVLNSWKKLANSGPYDWVILDPPSYQKGSFVAAKDYPKLVRHLIKVLSPGTKILACLNDPRLDEAFLKQVFAEQLPAATFVERLAPHVDFPEADRDRGLKLLVYQM